MENTASLGLTEKFDVAVFAEPEGLAISFVENLLIDTNRVTVFSENPDLFYELAPLLKENNKLKIVGYNQINEEMFFTHCIYFDISFAKLPDCSYAKLKKLQFQKIEKVINISRRLGARSIYVFPNTQTPETAKITSENIRALIKHQEDGQMTVFVGQIYGPRMLLTDRDLVPHIFYRAIGKRVLGGYYTNLIYPLYIADAAKALLKILFTESPSRFRTSVIGEYVSALDFINLVKETSGLRVINRKLFWNHTEGSVEDREVVGEVTIKTIKSTLDWFSTNNLNFLVEDNLDLKEAGKSAINIEKPSFNFVNTKNSHKKVFGGISISKISRKVGGLLLRITKLLPNTKALGQKVKKHYVLQSRNPIFKFLVNGVLVTCVILIVPTSFLVVSLGFMYRAQKYMFGGNFTNSKSDFLIASKMAETSKKLFGVYSLTPVLGEVFKSASKESEVFKKTAEIGSTISDIGITSTTLMKKIVGDQPYSVTSFSTNLEVGLDALYRDSSFLQSEVGGLSGPGSGYIKAIVDRFDLDKKREEVVGAKKLIGRLPWILSEDGQKRYMVLLQNNMELRPTGGFIGSFALVEFDHGRFINYNVFDVYSADGQLKGHIEPPKPIRVYIDQAGWFLRDSNWDPDFPTSAERAEWFLEKELDTPVDGVVAIDLNYIKDLVGILGPIELVDFDKTIDKNNLYDITQYEVENDFFPGSRKKENFLSSLAQSVVGKITKGEIDTLKFAETTYGNLNARHIQVFLHDKQTQIAFSSLEWDGGISFQNCQVDNCYSDWLGIVEANLGVNKANYFVKRSANLKVFLQEGFIGHTLEISLSSTANPALGNSGRYKTYTRVLTPMAAKHDFVSVVGGTENTFLEPEIETIHSRQEAGVYVEIGPGETKKITFNWKTDNNLKLSGSGEYIFKWRKQAGVGDDPINISIQSFRRVKIETEPEYSLTPDGVYVYNTLLTRDLVSRIYW